MNEVMGGDGSRGGYGQVSDAPLTTKQSFPANTIADAYLLYFVRTTNCYKLSE